MRANAFHVSDLHSVHLARRDDKHFDYFLTVILLLTFLTPSTALATCTALSTCALSLTKPLSITSPSLVSTLISMPDIVESASNAAFTLLVTMPSSIIVPAEELAPLVSVPEPEVPGVEDDGCSALLSGVSPAPGDVSVGAPVPLAAPLAPVFGSAELPVASVVPVADPAVLESAAPVPLAVSGAVVVLPGAVAVFSGAVADSGAPVVPEA